MSRFTSYYLYQKYEKVGDGEWTPTYPNEYSISGDSSDPMPLVIKTTNDPNCGYYPPIYRWTDTEDTICLYDYSKDYLTIESLEDNNVIYWKASQLDADYPPTPKTISASTDNGVTWTEYTSSTGGSGTTIATLNANDKLLLKGENTNYSDNAPNLFKTTGEFEVYGNIMSLISGNSFENAELTIAFAFHGIFSGCTGLTSAEKLILPATTLRPYCYQSMFEGCTNLTTAPELPSLNLSYMCYAYMFNGCTSLTVAPELPATTLTSTCYYYMFNDCTSLTVAPELPATTLVYMCYQGMFNGCANLNYIKCLATTFGNGSTYRWVNGVSSSGTFVKASSMSSWTTGTSGIPEGWTIQNA